jgi:hypothetical protein
MMAEILGNIEMTRGDSYPLVMTVKGKTSRLPVDLTGYAFKLTVSTEKAPVDDTNQVFQVVGVVDPDQVLNKGKVSFTPTTLNTANVLAKGYYDIQMTVGVIVRSINENHTFIIKQDKTKN